jgi:hypothetical protein
MVIAFSVLIKILNQSINLADQKVKIRIQILLLIKIHFLILINVKFAILMFK